MLTKDELFIGGRWVAPSTDERIEVIAPSTEEPFASVAAAAPADVDAAVAAARRAFEEGPWPRMSVDERAAALRTFMKHVESRMDDAIEQQIGEMGAPRRFLVPTTGAMGPSLERIIFDAESVPMVEVRDGTVGKVVLVREPIGVVGAIVPWNAPVMVAASKLFPSLLMGCPIALKPAPESPLSACLLAEAAEEAELPLGVLSVLPGGREVGEAIVAHRGVDMVTFTGSTIAGQAIAQTCGDQLKRATLELGGKSVALVLPGTDLPRMLPHIVGNSLRNSGQICISTNRVLVQRDEQPFIVEQLANAVGAMKIGDPHAEDTDFGPVVTSRQRDRVEGYIRSGLEQGATIALGGGRPAGLDRGWYVEPTIFTGVTNDMTIAQEEIFGPVLSVIAYDTVDEAIAIANDSEYGLGGAVFGPTVDVALAVASRIDTGTCAVNEGPPSGGGGPFGGHKRSGVGLERGPEGLEEFLEVKSLTLPAGADVPAGFGVAR